MATSKTLTPTNVTIQIPEFTDQPDQRVNSNCLDKEADAINALNTQISTLDTQIGKRAYKADKRISTNSDATFTFGSYYTSAIILATSGNDGILYIYSNGWLVPVKTASSISVTLSSNYLTITVHNGTASNLEVGCFSTNQEIVTN